MNLLLPTHVRRLCVRSMPHSTLSMSAARATRVTPLALPALIMFSVLSGGGATAQPDALQTGPAQAPFGGTPQAATSLVPDVLPAAQAFALNAFVEADTHVALLWEMPDGYYLYRKSLQLELPDGSSIDTYTVPEGDTVEDEFFGASEVYFERLLLRLPLSAIPADAIGPTADGGRQIDLLVSYQGCAQDKYCYPPQHVPLTLALP